MVVFLATPVVVLTVLGFFGDRHWTFDLASSPRPQYAAILGIASGLLVLMRRWWSALVITGFFAVNAVIVAPLWLDAPAEPAADSPAMRVLFHNVHGGDEERFEDVAEMIEAADVDLALFAGVPRWWVDEFAAAPGPYDYVFPPGRFEYRRVMAASRVPVDSAHYIDIDRSRTPALVLDVPLGSRRVKMLATHTLSPRTPARAADRDAVLAMAAQWAREQTEPSVVVGDLNVTPWTEAFGALLRNGVLLDSRRGYGLQSTYPAGAGPFMIPIDHLLHSEELTVVGRTTGPPLGSGHRSIIVDLAWAERS